MTSSANFAGIMRFSLSIQIIHGFDLTFLRLQHGMWTYAPSPRTLLTKYPPLSLMEVASPGSLKSRRPSAVLHCLWFLDLSNSPTAKHRHPYPPPLWCSQSAHQLGTPWKRYKKHTNLAAVFAGVIHWRRGWHGYFWCFGERNKCVWDRHISRRQREKKSKRWIEYFKYRIIAWLLHVSFATPEGSKHRSCRPIKAHIPQGHQILRVWMMYI